MKNLVLMAVKSRASVARRRAALRGPVRGLGAFALGLLSPTWGLAELVKRQLDDDWGNRPSSVLMKRRLPNTCDDADAGYSVVAVEPVRFTVDRLETGVSSSSHGNPFSRCTEVFVAFLRDATPQIGSS